MDTGMVSNLNKDAQRFKMAGNLVGAEAKRLEVLRLTILEHGENSMPVALTKHILGELYYKMGKLEEAQKILEEAEVFRTSKECCVRSD